MRYLLDTNVISERIKPRPRKSVIEWMNSVPQDQLYVSVLTVGELRYGVELLESSKRRVELVRWIDDILLHWFEDHIVPVDYEIANKWGLLTAGHKKTLSIVDSLLAATALVHNMTVVSGDKKGFNIPGLNVINPWDL